MNKNFTLLSLTVLFSLETVMDTTSTGPVPLAAYGAFEMWEVLLKMLVPPPFADKIESAVRSVTLEERKNVPIELTPEEVEALLRFTIDVLHNNPNTYVAAQ
ncbi:CUN021 hypothetical protein [Culex nigripalpus nucleopolyhedrovirus]|uniref:Uncharacterized protein n=1 Tax=Culex nigripalpus nucleopolyhedrovirus (isolate Florida/1997) TaxID=645993 RepID=Q919P8_NPVCO|nr:CUN021 hypothetical protein [Culex nigripalpus nucleopolyhedrovirus]AAK94099.1 CUN021 hypothetical protein [Culex nigripalpus nucleopolyhedrovirus]